MVLSQPFLEKICGTVPITDARLQITDTDSLTACSLCLELITDMMGPVLITVSGFENCFPFSEFIHEVEEMPKMQMC